VTGDQRFPRPRFSVDDHIVRRVTTNDRSEFGSDRLYLIISANDSPTFRDVTYLQQFLSSEYVGSFGIIFIKIKERVVSWVIVAVVEVGKVGRFLCH
jgi:AAA+ ATPase superfamily predicted ATPase